MTDGTGEAGLQRLHHILVDHARASRIIRELGILDTSGFWLTSSLAERPTHSNGDREYFIHHRDNPADKSLRINAPVISRVTGIRTILLTRRIESQDGRFLGVAFAAISVDYFQTFYDSLKTGDLGNVALYRNDGTLLVQSPLADETQDPDRLNRFMESIRQQQSGRSSAAFSYDGSAHLVAWSRLEDFPLIVVVSRAESDALADWRNSVTIDITVSIVAALVILLLGAVSMLMLRRRMAAESLAAEVGRRYAMIADTASDVIVHVGSDGRRLYVSPASQDVLGYAPDELLGQNLMDIVHPDDCGLLQEALGSLSDG
ncbi:MAG: cache domain-containing protein, partial [Ferrovibrio sp.]